MTPIRPRPALVEPFMPTMEQMCPNAKIDRRDPRDPKYLGCERPHTAEPRTIGSRGVRLEYQR